MEQNEQFSLFPELEQQAIGKKSTQRAAKPTVKATKPVVIKIDAERTNLALMKRAKARAVKEGSVLGPCLREYLSLYEEEYSPSELLSNLTGPLVRAFEETKSVIESNMFIKWNGDADMIARSVPNSLRRSAGTNYQTLVSYALARYFVETKSEWYISHPVPPEFKQALSISFTAGIAIQPEEKQAEGEEDAESPSSVKVQPDVDILLRNAAWPSEPDNAEPVLMLSVKTSLVDRAGMAARWKTYFDLANHPCSHQNERDCAYSRLGIQMENADKYDIHHGIVTANIYKLNFHDRSYRKGELATAQTRSNTHMFNLKLTTRDDDEAETPRGWHQFPYVIQVLEDISRTCNLPT
ncbi:MAG TPA: hypothetical protein VJ761_00110 [Ktedonobacteraceae bacterium]|nr:hypothetical protein [Ktedonobacteraceae bacterium]